MTNPDPDLPIAVFDSGLGGLTVLKALALSLPEESFLYLGDTARLPYGSKSISTIRRYVHQNIDFLLQQKVKAIVIACNSASSALLTEKIESAIPLYNVITPGAQKALSLTRNRRIGVLGARATVNARGYVK